VTYYLKYRPQKVDQLDLESVRQQLTTLLQSRNLPHAFLFTGPRGLGKTSAARILAKAINCEKKKKGNSFEPCNRCSACQSITSGSALDVIEIDGASNRGIDDVRQLREQINLSPGQLAKKIYVIDEVHMLTVPAFNALLKTLEEPPDHAFFILATTEPEKLPATIISRCFVLPFKRPTSKEIERSLNRVIKAEKLKTDKEVLEKIAQRADGSFRDAVKILEQLAFSKRKINQKLFDEVFTKTLEEDFLLALEKKEIQQALEWIEEANKVGIDWKTFLQTILFQLRDNLLVLYGIDKTKKGDFSEEELKYLIKLFSQAAQSMKAAPILHLPIELAVVEYGNRKENPATVKEAISVVKTEAEKGKKLGGKPALAFSALEEKWEEVLKAVKPQNHSVEALLRACRPKSIEGNKILVEVFYEFHKGRLETDKCRRMVENSLKQVFGKDLWIDYVLRERQVRPKPEVDKDDQLVRTAEEIFAK